MPVWTCNSCGLELSSKHRLQCHINRKFKCVREKVEHDCKLCNKQFKRKNLLEQHFRTDKQKRAVVAAETVASPLVAESVEPRVSECPAAPVLPSCRHLFVMRMQRASW